jgi:hypothetical protein
MKLATSLRKGIRVSHLDESEIQRRLDSYDQKDEALFRHLYEVGRTILVDLDQSSERLDKKAGAMILWDGAVIAFVLSRIEKLPDVALFASGALALLSGVAAFWSLWVRPSKAFADRAWFPEPSEARDLIGALKVHAWVSSGMRSRNVRVNQTKGKWLLTSQALILGAVLVLASVIILRSVGF